MSRRWAIALTTLALGCGPALAQQYVYPAKGQSAEQQKKDEGECYSWAVGQTGFDPAKPPPTAAAPTGPTGARARGAAAGAVVGAIADEDVGKAAAAGAVGGAAAQRGAKRQASRQQQQQVSAGQANFDKARGVCLEGRGYTIK